MATLRLIMRKILKFDYVIVVGVNDLWCLHDYSETIGL